MAEISSCVSVPNDGGIPVHFPPKTRPQGEVEDVAVLSCLTQIRLGGTAVDAERQAEILDVIEMTASDCMHESTGKMVSAQSSWNVESKVPWARVGVGHEIPHAIVLLAIRWTLSAAGGSGFTVIGCIR